MESDNIKIQNWGDFDQPIVQFAGIQGTTCPGSK